MIFLVIGLLIIGLSLAREQFIEFPLTFRKYKHIIQNSPILDGIEYYNPTFNFCLGMPNQCVEASLDTTSSNSWFVSSELKEFFNHTIDTNKSKTYEEVSGVTSMLFEGAILFGSISKDISTPFTEENQVVRKFVFGMLSISDLKGQIMMKDGNIGLMKALKDNNRRGNESTSYIEYLIDNKAIKHQIFSIEYFDDFKGGKITIGNNQKIKNLNSCSGVSSTFPYSWICSIKGAIYGTNELYTKDNENIFFDSLSPYITCPYEGGQFLLKNIIKGNELYCKIVNESYYDFIQCDKNVDLSKIKDIQLNLGKFNFAIYAKEIFTYRSIFNDYISLVIASHNELNNWNIGIPGMKSKKIIFNLETSEIGIIDKKPRGMNNFFKVMIFFTILIIIAIIVLLVRRGFNIKKSSSLDFDLMKN